MRNKTLFLFALLCTCFVPVLSAQTQVAPFVNSHVQFSNASGAAPCNGCLLDTFAAGTTTPLATYSESTGTTPNANPVVLASDGSAVVYLTNAAYKLRLRTAAGATLWTQDSVTWNNLATTLSSLTLTGNATINSPTAATNVANQSGPSFSWQGNFWNGSASAVDSFACNDVLGTGTNPTATLTCNHSGSSGASAISFIPPLQQVNKLYNAGAYATISAALTAAIAAGAPGVWIPCGTYSDNIAITQNTTLIGEDKMCVVIRPLVTANPVIKIDATSTGGIDGVIIENLSLQCSTLPWTFACGDGIFITGSQAGNQLNDHLTLRDLIIGNMYQTNTAGTFAFNNGIEMTGRSIYSNIERVQEFGSRNIGLKIALVGGSVGPINSLHVVNSSFFGNFSYGISEDCNGSISECTQNHFDTVEVTGDGQNTALSPCAGMLINGVWSTKLTNFYGEVNCPGTTDANSAVLRVNGSSATQNQIDIDTATLVMTVGAAKYGIYVDALKASGTWNGLRYILTAPTASIHVATTDASSHIVVLNATNMTKPDIVADTFGNTHVSIPAAGVFAKTVINNANCPLTANKFDLYSGCTGVNWSMNSIGVTAGPVTINNFPSGLPNQTLQVCSDSGVITLAHAAGGAGQMSFAGAVNKVLQSNECVLMRRILASDQWNEIAVSASKVLANAGTLAAPSIAFANDPGTGFENGIGGTGTVSMVISGVHQIEYAPSLQRNRAGTAIGWSSNTDPSVAASDTCLTRSAAGVVQVGSGGCETPNANGTLKPAAILSGGAAAGLTGTGACATFSTQTGGSMAGRATCTGTTGASTLTITPGTTAPNGWVCAVQDQTTRANLLQQTATVAASCTLTATSVTQNDVIVFTAIAF